MRAFFAVDLPDRLAAEIGAVQAELRGADGLTVTDPTQAHVTLKFLGQVSDDELDDVVEAGETAVGAADVGPFDVTVSDLGVFPSLEYISVVWIGVADGATQLARLHEHLEAETTALGYAPEDHEFTPHVTIARMKDARGKQTVQNVVRNRHPDVGTFTVEEVRLKESTQTEEGPVYDTVETFDV